MTRPLRYPFVSLSVSTARCRLSMFRGKLQEDRFHLYSSGGEDEALSKPPILRQKGCDNALRAALRAALELFSSGFVFSSKLLELIRVVVIFVVVILAGLTLRPRAGGDAGTIYIYIYIYICMTIYIYIYD